MSKVTIYTEEGVSVWEKSFGQFIMVLTGCVEHVNKSDNKRLSHLLALYSSVLEDAISIKLLLGDVRLNQGYILTRALLERAVNLCYLLMVDDEVYGDYIKYSKNKAVRSHKLNFDVDRETLASFHLNTKFPDDYNDAVNSFTSPKGREIDRWGVSINKRAKFISDNDGPNFYFDIMFVYSDASEAVHGTLYGSLFHLGVYSPEGPKDDGEGLSKWRCSSLCKLYLINAGILRKLVQVLEPGGFKVEGFAKLLDEIWEGTIEASDLIRR